MTYGASHVVDISKAVNTMRIRLTTADVYPTARRCVTICAEKDWTDK